MFLFVTTMLLINVTPGPDMLYVIARSAGQGRTAGIVSALGIGAGCFFHIFAVAFGLAEFLRAVPVAYEAVRYAGAAYLVWLGARMLLSRPRAEGPITIQPASLREIFVQGMINNILNPKVAMFFLAFLPQFIGVDAPSKPLAFATLGLVFNINGTLWNLGVAWVASRAAATRTGARLRLWLQRAIGGMLALLGVRLALAERG
jgi:threonine/homoserine/homoserine lactone efflux protein